MSTINLRDYLKGIEELIDSGRVEDALAHCRHVLEHFPKNVHTYRLMGKAYLESQRHSEAADLFQRVLASAPDDFVSHIGLSIINEDKEDLNAGIWHMERAFEAQPSNRAVQDELRRLYGKREGYEPAKVRLTRGALARMYAHGDLHTQAISELRSALAEDAQRPDLQVMLAEMYHRTGQQAQTIEVCSQIIQKLPYCLMANRIMADILHASQREVEAAPYWERVEELDPYAAQVGALSSPEQAAAETVTIEQLVLEEARTLPPPKAWTGTLQMPAGDEYEKEELPDWLSIDTLEQEDQPAEAAEETDTLLGSLEDLEPGEVKGEVETAPEVEPEPETAEEQPSSPFHSVSKSTALRADQVPDWLRELRPMTGSLTPPSGAEPQPEAEPEDPEQRWTDELKNAGFKPTGPLNLADTNPQPAAAPTPPKEIIGGLSTSELSWLDADLQEEPAAEEPQATPAQPEQPAEPKLPDWLNELNQQDKPAFSPASTLPVEVPTTPAFGDPEPAPIEHEQSEDPAELKASAGDDWLDDLKAESHMYDEPESEEPLATDDLAASRLDDLANWETQPSPAAEAEPAAAEPQAAENIPQPSQEDEENLSWLEGLAARQGAAEEELLTSPEERKLAKPEWLQASEIEPSEPAKSEALSWLDELAAAGNQVAEATGDLPAGGAAEELEDFDDLNEPAREGETPIPATQPEVMQPEVEAENGETAAREETTPEWLRRLSAEMESGLPPASEPVAPRQLEDAPDWLKDLSPESEASGFTEPEVEEAELPDPLQAAEDLGNADWLGSEEPEAEADAASEPPIVEPTWMASNEIEESPAEAAPTLGDLQPADEDELPPALSEPQAEAQLESEEELEAVAEPLASSEPETVSAAQTIAEPEPVAEVEPAGGRRQGGLRRRTTMLDAEQVEDRLAQARQALSYGNISDAAEAYGYMLRRRIRLEEIIADLRAALRRFPRQVTLWQTLGDAYMRNNQLKDALECYTRAETLL